MQERSPSSSNTVRQTLQEARKCQHPSEVDHQLWVPRATLTSVKVWKGVSEKVIGRCSLCSTKQCDLKKRMKSCIPKCRRWATLKFGNLKASEQP
ncbi:hypothetical protein CK203_001896 [Vitis vinifera]|uniref:Uncharacterized protein n=1 Tax=Vitis vinifera TaxID=29760 RepID=A0A438KK23_VITVI|nr:hypothetical protein CK203_001896 [Vitis vinifera]